jgi:5-methylcytosine-specific restriction endonuclease McrA
MSKYHGSYKVALFDPRWKEKRKVILERDEEKCVICKSEESLQVHHRQYHFSKSLNAFREPWEYTDNLLITLCESCHQRGHRLYDVPVKQVK